MPFNDLKLEEEEEVEDMTQNMRVGFKERQYKRFSEALPTTPPSAKKTRPKAPRKKPTLDIPTGKKPPFEAVRSCLELVVRPSSKNTSLAEDEVPVVAPGGKGKEKGAPAILSSWEEITELLKVVPCFTMLEPLAFGMEEFFSFSQCHFVNLGGIPCMDGMV